VVAGERHIIFDSGTGIRELGRAYMDSGVHRGDILLTHTHWDHINGFPFFRPAFQEDRHFRILAGHLRSPGGVRAILAGQMTRPMFPVPLETMRGHLEFEDFTAGDSFHLGSDVLVHTTQLNHPDGATGYRLEYGGKSMCYITDTEHVIGAPDENVLNLIAGADLVIYDCTYTDDEFLEKIGWGHSTWQEGIRLCQMAQAKKLVIFHHEPNHDDEFMTALEAEARSTWSEIIVAREGMSLKLD
jgi:phosphoribosyl 1,2-cyclic phosphodiesterase